MAGCPWARLVSQSLPNNNHLEGLPASARILQPGTIVNSTIELQELIGVGATSTVYKGWHSFLQRTVAVKAMHPELLADAVSTERFFREAKLLSTLKHNNLVVLLAYGREDIAGHFIVMEFVEGSTLAKLLQREKALTPIRALALAS